MEKVVEKESKIVKRGTMYYCIEDEGSEKKGECRTGYKNEKKVMVQSHQHKVHYKREYYNEYGRKWNKNVRAEISLTAYVTLKEEEGLLPLFPTLEYNSDSDWEDDVPLQIRMDMKKIEDAEEKKYAAENQKYNASHYVSYVPETPYLGPEATYSLRNEELKKMSQNKIKKMTKKEKAKYIFSFYFGTSSPTQSKPNCGYLDGSAAEGAKLVNLMNEGHVCWRKDFTFSGKSSDENRDDAMDWQHFYKHVNLYKKFVSKDPTEVEVQILNGGLRRKNSYKRVLSREVKDKAKRIAWQDRNRISITPYLLKQDPEDQQWTEHKLRVNRK